MTEHKHQAVSWELLRVLISAFCIQSSASLILLILKSGALRKAHFISRNLVQWTKGGLKLSIKILHVLFTFNPSPAWLLRILTLWALKGPVQRGFKGTSFRSVRETLTGTGNAIPHPHHLPKPSLAINRQYHPKVCGLLIQSLGGIKIARVMLWKASVDDGDVFTTVGF